MDRSHSSDDDSPTDSSTSGSSASENTDTSTDSTASDTDQSPVISHGRRTLVARVRRWFLLTGDRWYVTAVILLAIFVGLGPVGHALVPVGPDTFGPNAVRPLLTTLLSGSFLLVSIVVSINSLFVSQEQTPLGRQFDRIRDVGEFRRDIESLIDTPISPAEPARFLRLLTGSILARAQLIDEDIDESVALGDAAARTALRSGVDSYVTHLAEETRVVSSALDDADSTFELVVATMDYDYSRQANDLRRLRSGHDLPEEAEARIQSILDLLQYFATAREYFKTLYFGREFADLSNGLLLVSLPTIALVAFVLLHLNSFGDLHAVATLVTTVALAPFALLAAYVVRVGTIARRTRASGQFVVEERSMAGRTPTDD
ncbi:hypothetical protein [Salinirubrum litoreum]|uniref:Uncharacterized protein n=1 Tax=Salinirubrum litoreum TaxID=1126234 RepID=A0ABD5RAV1_9EURY|nr:hypothetical protein [Salinirubrum litoreum]